MSTAVGKRKKRRDRHKYKPTPRYSFVYNRPYTRLCQYVQRFFGNSDNDSCERSRNTGENLDIIIGREIVDTGNLRVTVSVNERSLDEMAQDLHCKQCAYFYGKKDLGNYLHCAPHPFKPENTLECLDYERNFNSCDRSDN
jgi:hypothetical protein